MTAWAPHQTHRRYGYLVLRFLLGFAVPTFAGCSAPSRWASGKALPPITRPSAFDRLTIGMSAEEVHALLGKPHAITPVRQDGETWHYLRKVDEVVRRVSLTTREVPAVNPITGQSIIIQEPVMSDAFTTLYEDIDLLLAEGRIVEISRRQRIEEKIQ